MQNPYFFNKKIINLPFEQYSTGCLFNIVLLILSQEKQNFLLKSDVINYLTKSIMKHRNYGNVLKKTLFFFCVLFTFGTYAQDNVVTGTVTAEDGEPLPGVNIVQRGTNNGVVADFDGNYEITLRSGSQTLVFSYVGYSSKEVPVAGQSVISVVLIEDAQALDEVVVTGYGTQRRSDLTGSVASVKGNDIAVTPVPTFDVALQGRAAGVSVVNTSSEPGGGSTIRIRGSNSISGNNEPLIVLDGYPLPSGGEASTAGIGAVRVVPSNPLNFLNPNDIASIDVLKDAASTAIYGSRGANGVIVITTKKGTYGQKAKINLTVETAGATSFEFPEMMDGPTFAAWRLETADQPNPRFNNPESLPTTDWLDNILRTGFVQRYQLDINGGSEKTRYSISGNYQVNEGVVKFTEFERGVVSLKLDTKLSDRLSVSTTINLSQSLNNRNNQGTGAIINGGGVWKALTNDPSRTPEDTDFILNDPTEFYFIDPVVDIRDTKDQTADKNVFANVFAKYTILDGLTLNVRAGVNSKNSRREVYYKKTTSIGARDNGRAVYNTFEFDDQLLESYLAYDKTFGAAHNLNLVGGYSSQANTTRGVNNTVINFPADALGSNNIGLGLTPSIPQSSRIERSLLSYYFRANYDFNKKYFVSLTMRADGSSVFAENEKWGYFPSAGVGWTVSEESFLKDSKTISNLKFRASYGITGSQSIAPLQSLTLLGVQNANFNDALAAGLSPVQLGNQNLKWEETTQINAGLDFGLFNERVFGSIDYYVKTTDNLLQNFPIPTSSGLSSLVVNAGSIENSGVEITLGADIVNSTNFNWNTNINWSANKSLVKSLGEGGSDIFGPNISANIVAFPSNVLREGEEFGLFWGQEAIGLYPLGDDQEGELQLADLNGDGVISANDNTIIGNPNPDFIFGWNNSFTYKNLTLSAFFQGSIGNDIMNVDRIFISGGIQGNSANHTQEYYERRWTPQNPHNDVRFPAGRGGNPDTSLIEDGSYVRLKNISLSYNFSPEIFNGFLSSARLYVTGTNLLTFTNYSGVDPEVNVFGGNNINRGVDFSAYPKSKQLLLGLNIGF
ncbi:SusC/RagA family TonB-linked outer membrane protein [Ulvibacterium marinum]|uniref:TonB-dependent receptor n=1 Tax=Ulvibacterium marinum TaxID=2419782 RepID=A0A3B0C5Q8_9FLAO|nr:TonB-dependent receptor [Ulvibacterium marinum]RKN78666.1 TonB-dependent receptor [Ulvibacterium marinum]